MTPPVLQRWSEPFAPSGGVAANGVRNALGRPHMGLPTLLVRETVQNSWDAGAKTDIRPVRFRVDVRTMRGPERAALRTNVFSDLPDQGIPLREVLDREDLPIVVISDRGTSGLGGPTRADVRTDEPSDFADFVRNVGQPPDKPKGGGTYGYGKAVLFLASAASTIVAYSRCDTPAGPQSRLIGIGLGNPFAVAQGDVDRRFTGRHWWGLRDETAGIEPVTGTTADEIATIIGMPGFADGEFGTSVMIVGAEFGESDLRSAVDEMANAAAWFCWPKLLSMGEVPADMEISLSLDGQEYPLPDPASHPELRAFVQAYRAALGGEPARVLAARVETVQCGRPKQELGRIAIVQVLQERNGFADVPGRPFQEASHHVALMRDPRLVVGYLPGPESPVPGTAWAGVFIADPAVDRAFAASEPPSHDEWAPHTLPRSPQKTFVTVGLREIRNAMKVFSRPEPPQDDAEVVPLAGLAAALGGLLAGDQGPGARFVEPSGRGTAGTDTDGGGKGGEAGRGTGTRGGSGGRAGGGRKMPRITVLQHRLVTEDGAAAVAVSFRVTAPTGAERIVVRAAPSVTINDGSSIEREQPAGAERPRVLKWMMGDRPVRSPELRVEGNGEVEATVFVHVPNDTSVAVALTAEAESGTHRDAT